MNLYIVRHAIAVPHGTPGIPEDERPLTPEGIRKMRRSAKALALLELGWNEIWTSPLPRARQTAEIVAAELNLTKSIRNVDHLRPEGDFEALVAKLASLGGKKEIALVGHEPGLGQLVTWLLTGEEDSVVEFRKGAVICLQINQWVPPTDNKLLWMLTPRLMARLTRVKE